MAVDSRGVTVRHRYTCGEGDGGACILTHDVQVLVRGWVACLRPLVIDKARASHRAADVRIAEVMAAQGGE